MVFSGDPNVPSPFETYFFTTGETAGDWTRLVFLWSDIGQAQWADASNLSELDPARIIKTGSPSVDLGLCLLPIDSVRETLGYPADAVLAMLEEAMNAAPDSAAVRVGLGEAYFNQSRLAQAEEQFRWVVDHPGAAGASRPGGTSPRAEAFYYLSVINTLGSPSAGQLNAAVADAREADRIGGGAFRYRRQACLAHIMRGGDSVTDGDVAEWCQGNDTPEGRLLSGMAHLRIAQHVPNVQYTDNRERWLDELRAARSEFTRGASLVAGLSPQERVLQWPGMPAPLPVADLLAFGGSVIIAGCSDPLAEPDFASEASTESIAARPGPLSSSPSAAAASTARISSAHDP